jgi:hypothetical protein
VTFHNRHDELALIQDRGRSDQAEFLVVYGRRRIGKTELLSHVAENERALYFEATNTVSRDQLRDLTAQLVRVTGDPVLAAQPLGSWDAALAAIAVFVGDRRTLVVLDEFQYLAARAPELESTLSRWWREVGRRLPIVLVLAGSELAFFEDQVLAGQLYGRRTGQLKVEPFLAREAALFHPSYGPEDRVRVFSVAGGVPYYLERFTGRETVGEAILREVLDRSGLLHDEAELMLRQSIADPTLHAAVLRSIAEGRNHNNEISQRTGLQPAHVTKILETLERLGLVARLRPVTSSPRARKTAYAVIDHFLRFHYRFLAPARSQLRTRALAAEYLTTTVLPHLDHHASLAWEDVARQHVLSDQPAATDIGRWWGQVPTGIGARTEEREIDVVAVDGHRRPVAFGMCKWTAKAVDIDELALLRRVATSVPGYSGTEREYLFSRSGFTPRVREEAASRPVLVLVGPADVYERTT